MIPGSLLDQNEEGIGSRNHPGKRELNTGIIVLEHTVIVGGLNMGEFKRGIANGKGVYFWPNGTTYVGEFINDRFHGYGIQFSPKGAKEFEGSWTQSKFNYAKNVTLGMLGQVDPVSKNQETKAKQLSANTDADVLKTPQHHPNRNGQET